MLGGHQLESFFKRFFSFGDGVHNDQTTARVARFHQFAELNRIAWVGAAQQLSEISGRA
jgi:hypothetical protein